MVFGLLSTDSETATAALEVGGYLDYENGLNNCKCIQMVTSERVYSPNLGSLLHIRPKIFSIVADGM